MKRIALLFAAALAVTPIATVAPALLTRAFDQRRLEAEGLGLLDVDTLLQRVGLGGFGGGVGFDDDAIGPCCQARCCQKEHRHQHP